MSNRNNRISKLAFRTATECAAITHGHPSGYLSAGAFACIIAEIINGKDVRQAATSAISILKTYEGYEECLDAMQNRLSTFGPFLMMKMASRLLIMHSVRTLALIIIEHRCKINTIITGI